MQAFVEDGCGTQACQAEDALDMTPQARPFVLPPRNLSCGTAFEMVGELGGLSMPEVLLALLHARPRRPREPWRLAEVGVLYGETTEKLLQWEPNVHVLAVDAWEFAGDGYRLLPGEAERGGAQQVLRRLDRFRPRFGLLPMRSVDAARFVAPRSLDVVFLDGDHRHATVEADIDAWAGAVAPWGVLAGHDYSLGFPGVIRAVRAFADRACLSLHLGSDSTWWLDFAERPRPNPPGTEAAGRPPPKPTPLPPEPIVAGEHWREGRPWVSTRPAARAASRVAGR